MIFCEISQKCSILWNFPKIRWNWYFKDFLENLNRDITFNCKMANISKTPFKPSVPSRPSNGIPPRRREHIYSTIEDDDDDRSDAASDHGIYSEPEPFYSCIEDLKLGQKVNVEVEKDSDISEEETNNGRNNVGKAETKTQNGRNDIDIKVSQCMLTLKVLNFWKFTSYCSLKPLWSGMGEVVPARTSLTLHPPSPSTVHQLSWLAL